MKTAALYARVSTKKQDNETQLRQLREYADRRGLVVADYVDVISTGKEFRFNLQRLMTDARLKLFDVVIVARFDRFARSTRELVTALEEFQVLGIHFISLSESIDTSTPAGKMVFTMISAFAEFERNIIRERVRAGIEKARSKGKRLGRPKRIVDKEKVAFLSAAGQSVAQISRKLGVSRRTAARILKDRLADKTKVGKNPFTLFAHSDSFQTESPALLRVGKNK